MCSSSLEQDSTNDCLSTIDEVNTAVDEWSKLFLEAQVFADEPEVVSDLWLLHSRTASP